MSEKDDRASASTRQTRAGAAAALLRGATPVRGFVFDDKA
jgi:hypothetical protein